MDPCPTNYLRQNIVFSYPEMIRVSFSLFLSLSVFCYFTLLLIFMKIILLLLLLLFYCYYFFHENYFYFFMFWDVPECSGMFRNVPECSGMFHVPGFINALCFISTRLQRLRQTDDRLLRWKHSVIQVHVNTGLFFVQCYERLLKRMSRIDQDHVISQFLSLCRSLICGLTVTRAHIVSYDLYLTK